jgi:Ca2+:H+ antiporter
VRWVLVGGLALGPVVVIVDRLHAAGGFLLFVLAAAALVPLAWLIGEATEEAARRTGAGIGGFLNASFGNAPELIVSLAALAHGLPSVVLASLTGSIASNLLLVLGLAVLVRAPRRIDRTSAAVSLGTVGVAVLVLLVPATVAYDDTVGPHSLAELSVAAAVALLLARVVVNRRMLQRQRQQQARADPAPAGTWPLRVAVLVLAAATVMTAFVTEILVGTLESFAAAAHLSEFFVAAVIVAIVGNAAEHGSAVLVAVRGDTKLATEIALASSAQVAAFLIPVVAVLSWTIEPLSLSFRPIELAAIGGAAVAAAIVLAPQRATRTGGAALVAGYLSVVVSFYVAGNP